MRAALVSVGHPRAGVIGRLSHEKGVDLFLESVRLLAERDVPVQGIIAGDGPERRRLEARVSALGVADRVHFLGPVYPAGPLYPELDVVVIPSRSEGLPNVLLEALSADRRVVSTDVGAVTEVLSDPRSGRVVRRGDPAALADAIESMLRETQADGAGARHATAARYSLARRVDAHIELYRSLLDLPAMPVAQAAR